MYKQYFPQYFKEVGVKKAEIKMRERKPREIQATGDRVNALFGCGDSADLSMIENSELRLVSSHFQGKNSDLLQIYSQSVKKHVPQGRDATGFVTFEGERSSCIRSSKFSVPHGISSAMIDIMGRGGFMVDATAPKHIARGQHNQTRYGNDRLRYAG